MRLVEKQDGGQLYMYVSLQISSVFSTLADETLHSLAISLEKMNLKFLTTKLPERNLFLSWGLRVIYRVFSRNKIAWNGYEYLLLYRTEVK